MKLMLMRVTPLLAVLLMALILPGGGKIAPAAAQDSQEQSLAYIAGLQDMHAVTAINQSQTVENSTLRLDWAYADRHTVLVHLILSNPTDKFNDPNAKYYYSPVVDIVGEQGEFFETYYNWGGQLDQPNGQVAWEYVYAFDPNQAYLLATDSTDYTPMPDYLTTHYGDASPSTLTYRLLADLETSETWTRSRSFGVSQHPAMTFDFEVTVNPAYTVLPDMTQVSGDVALTLQRIELTPGTTYLEFCVDSPVSAAWYAQPVVKIGEAEGYLLHQVPAGPRLPARCFSSQFAMLNPLQGGVLTVTVDGLRSAPPNTHDYWEAVAAKLAERDIIIKVVQTSTGYSYEPVSHPTTMTDDEAYTIQVEVMQSLLPTLDGTWTFEVGLP